MDDSTSRHQLFQTARADAGWSVQQLWVNYLAVGGTRDAFDIEAYLYGLAPLGNAEQDVLANALNERLYDLYLAAKVPYVFTTDFGPSTATDPLTILDEMLRSERADRRDSDDLR